MNAIDRLEDTLIEVLEEGSTAEALSIVTGIFVSLTLGILEQRGLDTAKEINIDGGINRDITIHAPKAGLEQPQGGEDE